MQATTIDGSSACVGVRHIENQGVAIIFHNGKWCAAIEVYHLESYLIVGSSEVARGCPIGDCQSAAR